MTPPNAEVAVSHHFGHFSLEFAAALAPGWTVLFGPSGAGKTTVLRSVAGLLAPERGSITVGNEMWLDTARDINMPAHRRRCGWVAQHAGLFAHLDVAANVAFGLRGLQESERCERMNKVMRVFHCEQFAARRPAELSGGERQRIALARALAPAPRVLLLDEPFRGLDLELRAAVLDDLLAWHADHPMIVLAVFHDPLEALAVRARVLRLHAGHIVADGPAQEVLAPERAYLAWRLSAAEEPLRNPASGERVPSQA